MLITPETYFAISEIDMPPSTFARLKHKTKAVEDSIEKFLRRQAKANLDALPDNKEYRVEFGDMIRLPSTKEHYILFKLPYFVYLNHPEEAEIGEVVHPAIFEAILDNLDVGDSVKTNTGKKFNAVMDSHLFKILPVIDKLHAVKYFQRVE